ncbi:MAG: DUF447 family protein [Desulfosporosinus sp.]|nr:DUF447 family protein [Desulfosporosinus sp.]
MIVETIISSISYDDVANFAPMGLHISDLDHERVGHSPAGSICLRLFPGSRTYANLKATGQGVVNFTNNVLDFVDTALFSACPSHRPSLKVRPPSMEQAQTIWEFAVTRFDSASVPALVEGKIEYCENRGGFAGFCRGQGAVLEATIAATRWQFLPSAEITQPWPMWLELVKKTGGKREFEAFSKISSFLAEKGILVPGMLQGTTKQEL